MPESIEVARRVVAVADAHLGGPGGTAAPLVEQLDRLGVEDCSHALFLGDLFHIWVGAKRYETPAIHDCVEAIRRLRQRGVRTLYIEGNRDFFIDGSPYADAFDEVTLRWHFRCGGQRYLAVHGDGVDRSDRQYLFWRWLSKSLPSRLLFRRIPGVIARRIVSGTEQRLARTNFRHRMQLPEQALRQLARDQRREHGVDWVVLGHFHQDVCWQNDDGAYRIVDAWYECPALFWIDENGFDYGPRTAVVAHRGEADD